MEFGISGANGLAQARADLRNTRLDRFPVGALDHDGEQPLAQLTEIPRWVGCAGSGSLRRRRQPADRGAHHLLGYLGGEHLCDVGNTVYVDDGERDGCLAQGGPRQRFLEALQKSAPVEPGRGAYAAVRWIVRDGAAGRPDDANRAIGASGRHLDGVFAAAAHEAGVDSEALRYRFARQLPEQCGDGGGPGGLERLTVGLRG